MFYFLCYLMRLERLIPKEVAVSDIATVRNSVSSRTNDQSPPFVFVNKIFTMSKRDFKKN